MKNIEYMNRRKEIAICSLAASEVASGNPQTSRLHALLLHHVGLTGTLNNIYYRDFKKEVLTRLYFFNITILLIGFLSFVFLSSQRQSYRSATSRRTVLLELAELPRQH